MPTVTVQQNLLVCSSLVGRGCPPHRLTDDSRRISTVGERLEPLIAGGLLWRGVAAEIARLPPAKQPVMTTATPFVYAHLATVLPAFVIGTYMMVARKGSKKHRLLGKIYMLLMLATAIFALFINAEVGPKFLGHFGFIHLFSVLVLYSVPSAYFAAKRHDRRTHTSNMIGLYFGGLLIAGGFTLMPGRLIHTWLFT